MTFPDIDPTKIKMRLRPCPFCNAYGPENIVLVKFSDDKTYCVGCQNCGAHGPEVLHMVGNETHAAIAAAMCWNGRQENTTDESGIEQPAEGRNYQ